ncbi:MAG: hypothetical protein V4671_00380 [Armatimonadota bacterium]
MEVVKERFEDAGEPDAQGFYEYYYSGYLYRFRFGREGFVARQYDDTPGEVGFLMYEIKTTRKWKAQQFNVVPYDNPAFRDAVKHLREHEKIHRILVLLNDYVPVDMEQMEQATNQAYR